MPGKFLSAVVGAALLGTIGTANAGVALTDSLLDTVTAGSDTNSATVDVSLSASQSNSNSSSSTQSATNSAASVSGDATAASSQDNTVKLVNAIRQSVRIRQ